MSKLESVIKTDFQTLLDNALDATSYLLRKNKEFYPFAMSLNTVGKVTIHGTETEDDNTSQAIIDEIVIDLGRLDNLIAATVVSMGLAPNDEQQNVIRMDFDHINGSTMMVTIPYDFKSIKKELILGDAEYMEGSRLSVRLFK